jgi:hypothetical protein
LLRLALPLTDPHNCWRKIVSARLPADGSWLFAHALITE